MSCEVGLVSTSTWTREPGTWEGEARAWGVCRALGAVAAVAVYVVELRYVVGS